LGDETIGEEVVEQVACPMFEKIKFKPKIKVIRFIGSKKQGEAKIEGRVLNCSEEVMAYGVKAFLDDKRKKTFKLKPVEGEEHVCKFKGKIKLESRSRWKRQERDVRIETRSHSCKDDAFFTYNSSIFGKR
jgi:hypothetical protein